MDTPEPRSEQSSSDLSFEAALARLEEIVRTLEKGEAPLDQSIELYQEGVGLSAFCTKKLDEAKGKIEIALKEGGKFAKKDFDPSEENTGDEKTGRELF